MCTIARIGSSDGPQVSVGYHVRNHPDLLCDINVDSFAISKALCGEDIAQVTGIVKGAQQTFTCGIPQQESSDSDPENLSKIFLPSEFEPCVSVAILCAVVRGTSMDGFT